MKRRRWVRGKALEVVIALGSVRPGDEVLLRFDKKRRQLIRREGNDRRYLVYDEKEVPFIIDELPIDKHIGSGAFTRTVRGAESKNGWGFFWSEVVAWRPGKKEKP